MIHQRKSKIIALNTIRTVASFKNFEEESDEESEYSESESEDTKFNYDDMSENELKIVSECKNRQVVYIMMITLKTCKFGFTSNIERRYFEHQKTYGDIILVFACVTIFNREVERDIKKKFEHMIEDGTTEVLKLDSKITQKILEEYIKERVVFYENSYIREWISSNNEEILKGYGISKEVKKHTNYCMWLWFILLVISNIATILNFTQHT
jgi:hypothetical protein